MLDGCLPASTMTTLEVSNKDMDAEMELKTRVSIMILAIADEAEELTRSDFQSRADMPARQDY